MILDFDAVQGRPAGYDVCIAGAGVAGITIAHRLAGRGKRVLLLEGGGETFSEDSQGVYRGENIGHEYFPLDTARLRFLGGTSNHWGGWCRYLDPYDFEERPYIPHSGWPISFDDVNAYLPEALDILELEPFAPDRPFEGADSQFMEFEFRIKAIRFGEKYRDFLAQSSSVDLLINANVVDIRMDGGTGRISSFSVEGYSGKKEQITAGDYILAMGGIENARALLNANTQLETGIGNQNDVVGRYFMEHIVFTLGYYTVDSSKSTLGSDGHVYAAPTPAFQDKAKVANCGMRFLHINESGEPGLAGQAKDFAKGSVCESDILTNLVRSMQWFDCPPPFDRAGLVRAASEQVPNPRSRVLLSDEKDRFGQRRIALDWRLSPIDKQTMRKCMLAVAAHFATKDIGRIKLDPWLMSDDLEFPPKEADELAGYHHMGTTRMGSSDRDSVVDANCKVFGVPNLYVAGSSVFRTGGHSNPTLPIVQLSLRLADHLAQTNAGA